VALGRDLSNHRSEINNSPKLTSDVLHRISRAFGQAKNEAEFIESPYRVGQMWQAIIEREWEELLRAIAANDLATTSSLLENFSRSSFSRLPVCSRVSVSVALPCGGSSASKRPCFIQGRQDLGDCQVKRAGKNLKVPAVPSDIDRRVQTGPRVAQRIERISIKKSR